MKKVILKHYKLLIISLSVLITIACLVSAYSGFRGPSDMLKISKVGIWGFSLSAGLLAILNLFLVRVIRKKLKATTLNFMQAISHLLKTNVAVTSFALISAAIHTYLKGDVALSVFDNDHAFWLKAIAPAYLLVCVALIGISSYTSRNILSLVNHFKNTPPSNKEWRQTNNLMFISTCCFIFLIIISVWLLRTYSKLLS